MVPWDSFRLSPRRAGATPVRGGGRAEVAQLTTESDLGLSARPRRRAGTGTFCKDNVALGARTPTSARQARQVVPAGRPHEHPALFSHALAGPRLVNEPPTGSRYRCWSALETPTYVWVKG